MATGIITNLRLDIEFEGDLKLLDFSSFLYDFELIHDFTVLCSSDIYESYIYTPSLWRGVYGGRFWIRAGRPLWKEHRLGLSGMDIHSPGSIILGVCTNIIPNIISPLIDTLGKLKDWNYNREKARDEAEKARQDAISSGYNADTALIQRETALLTYGREKIRLSKEELEIEQRKTEKKLLDRMEKNSINVIDLSIYQNEGDQDSDNS